MIGKHSGVLGQGSPAQLLVPCLIRNTLVEDWSQEVYDSKVFHASTEILLLRIYSTRPFPLVITRSSPQYAMFLWRFVQWLNVLCMKSWTWSESKSIHSYMRSRVDNSYNLELGIPSIFDACSSEPLFTMLHLCFVNWQSTDLAPYVYAKTTEQLIIFLLIIKI